MSVQTESGDYIDHGHGFDRCGRVITESDVMDVCELAASYLDGTELHNLCDHCEIDESSFEYSNSKWGEQLQYTIYVDFEDLSKSLDIYKWCINNDLEFPDLQSNENRYKMPASFSIHVDDGNITLDLTEICVTDDGTPSDRYTDQIEDVFDLDEIVSEITNIATRSVKYVYYGLGRLS